MTGALVAVILTLLVFSRLLGDNPAFRFVQYLFVGVSLGYAFVVVYHQVLRPGTLQLIDAADNPSLLMIRVLPFLLGLLLLARLTARQSASWLANIPLALLFGVGAALALGGALVGTLVPQLLDTARPDTTSPAAFVGAVVLLLGVVTTLCYFYFTLPRTTPTGRLVAVGARAGRWLLVIAFGFFLAGSLLTYLAALNGQIDFLVNLPRLLLGS
ncbi:MAG: hypothetical protein HC822_03245 [Oscillochloris sp.]|nr:hypothetical protein [Oscillochloris sp.]